MDNKVSNKYFYIISVIVALLVIGITISASFAFFTNSGSANTGKATVITSGSLSLELVDGNVVGTTNGMVPGDFVTKTFIVRNTGTIDTVYDVYFSEVYNTFADKSDLVYSLSSSDGGYNTISDQVIPSTSGDESKIINAYSINAGESHTYTLTIKFLSKNENQDDNKGKTFSGKLQINEYKDYEIKYALLDTGSNVRSRWNYLAGSGKIKSIQRANSLVNTDNVISTQDSQYPVYTWYDNGIIYVYSEANKLKLNQNCSYMFNLYYLESIDENMFDASDVVNMSYMFYYTLNLKSLDLSDFNSNIVENMSGFLCDSGVESVDISGINTSHVTNMNELFRSTKSLTNVNFGDHFVTDNVQSMRYLFYRTALEELDLSNWNTSSLTDASDIFDESSIKKVNVSNWDFTHFSTSYTMMSPLSQLFSGNNIVEIIARNIKLDSANLENSFNTLSEVTKIDITGIDVGSKQISMRKSFYNCPKLETIIGLTDLDTSNITNMYFMFRSTNIKTLDLSNFDTSNVEDMFYMLSIMPNLTTVYVSDKWNVSNVSETAGLFDECPNIVGGAGTTYDSNHTGAEYAHVDGGPTNPGYLTLKTN